jgi:hypothetical protein
VDVVNAVAGPLAGISIAEHVAITSIIKTSVPFPGCIRTPHLTVTKNKVVYAALFAYRHLLFGVLMDTLSRLAGLQPRQVHSSHYTLQRILQKILGGRTCSPLEVSPGDPVPISSPVLIPRLSSSLHPEICAPAQFDPERFEPELVTGQA